MEVGTDVIMDVGTDVIMDVGSPRIVRTGVIMDVGSGHGFVVGPGGTGRGDGDGCAGQDGASDGDHAMWFVVHCCSFYRVLV
jgi:hypothetical protein